MNYLDLMLLIPLLYGLARGAMRGFVVEVASTVALVAGLLGAIYFSKYTQGLIQEYTEYSGDFLGILSFALTFVGIIIGIHILAKFIQKVLQLAALGLVNRVAGAVFGTLKMALICSFVLTVIKSAGLEEHILSDESKNQSWLFKPVSKVGPAILPMIQNADWFKAYSFGDVEELLNEQKLFENDENELVK
jgi:membrane protein required for colicin V production